MLNTKEIALLQCDVTTKELLEESIQEVREELQDFTDTYAVGFMSQYSLYQSLAELPFPHEVREIRRDADSVTISFVPMAFTINKHRYDNRLDLLERGVTLISKVITG